MNVYFLLAVLIVAALLVKAILNSMASKPGRTAQGDAEAGAQYIQTDALFTPAERAFLETLDTAAGQHYRVFGKVRVADVIGVLPGREKASWQRAFNKISAKHFDFVLCRRDSMEVVAAIELNDASHNKKKRQTRDLFLKSTCDLVGLPLIMVEVRAHYSAEKLREEIAGALRSQKVNSVTTEASQA